MKSKTLAITALALAMSGALAGSTLAKDEPKSNNGQSAAMQALAARQAALQAAAREAAAREAAAKEAAAQKAKEEAEARKAERQRGSFSGRCTTTRSLTAPACRSTRCTR